MAISASYFGNYDDDSQPTYLRVVDYFVDVRRLLQDEVPPYRYTDESLLTALNATMLEARRVRADFFVYDMSVRGQTQSFTAVDDTKVRIEPQFRLAFVHGIVGHAYERDQEDVQDNRSQSFLAMFYAGLVGRGIPGPAGGSGPGRPPTGGQP